MWTSEQGERERAINDMKYPKPKCRASGCGNDTQVFSDGFCYSCDLKNKVSSPMRNKPPKEEKEKLDKLAKGAEDFAKRFIPDKNYERDHSHYHCWQNAPKPSPCGQKIEDHVQCCLCELKPPRERRMKIILPIYYTQILKTKPKRTILIGLNWYRNAHWMLSNKIKSHYHDLIKEQIGGNKFEKIKVCYNVYVRRSGTDGPNVRSILEKFFLDGLVEAGAIPGDDVKHVVEDSSAYFIDSENPRIEIEIIGL